MIFKPKDRISILFERLESCFKRLNLFVSMSCLETAKVPLKAEHRFFIVPVLYLKYVKMFDIILDFNLTQQK